MAAKKQTADSISEKQENGKGAAVPLRRNIKVGVVQGQKESWFTAIESVVQVTIKNLRKRTLNNIYLSGVRDLESTCFAQSLINMKNVWFENHESESYPLELEIFSRPVGLVSFQVHDRKYSCIKYPVEEGRKANSQNYQNAIRILEKTFASNRIDVEEQPTTEEIMSILVDHLSEDIGESESKFQKIGDYIVGPVLRPRRSAIRDWQNRLETWITDQYDHEEDNFYFYSYPIVDLLLSEGKYLVLLMISPLDQNFVDEKVSIFNQVAEITLAIFDIEKFNYSRVLQSVAPQLKQAYGRVLFTNMHEEASRALTDTFDDQSRILRHWVRMAAKGYDGLVDEKLSQGIFDSTKFLDAIVDKILCADIDNVDTEVYPFDRVFIFKEAGSSSAKSIKEPIEVLIMETSILSNNPADRNQFLTARERSIRGTMDFERDASRKIIKDEDIFKFYLHSNANGIIFSQKAKLAKEDEEYVLSDRTSSRSHKDSSQRVFFVKLPDAEEGNEISDVLSNLCGRLIPTNFDKKETFSPQTGIKLFETHCFDEEFEKRRLQVTEKFNNFGLYFKYSHGIHLPTEIPLLANLQDVYFEFLKVHFKDRDEQHLRDRYRQDNLDNEQMEQILAEHRNLEKDQREKLRIKQRSGDNGDQNAAKKQASKVVYIAFSWELHDENMEILRNRQTSTDDLGGDKALMGEEYTYTMILVSDLDPEKSLSQLNAERENLRMFFELIMDRIWMDKKFELFKLNNRSTMIVSSLSQFTHRVKSFVDKKHKVFLDNEITKLKSLTQPKGTTASLIEIEKPESFFGQLLDLPGNAECSPADIKSHIQKWLTTVFQNSSLKVEELNIDIDYHSIPKLEVRWSKVIVREAFENAIKNACEAALGEVNPKNGRNVSVQLQAFPVYGYSEDLWHFDIVIENSGGPIPEGLISQLNAPNPKQLARQEKEGSTGLGIFISRFQLINDIGSGADLIFLNLENGNVQARLRLPAKIKHLVSAEEQQDHISQITLRDNYILYVEDDEEIHKETVPDLEKALEDLPIVLVHRKSLQGAKEYIDQKMPLAVFSDYNIYQHEYGGGSLKKHGNKLLSSVIKNAKDRNQFPPIWVLTGERESEVIKGLDEVGIDLNFFGYKIVPENQNDVRDFVKQGSFVIFSEEKNPTKLDGFEEAIKCLVEEKEASDEDLPVPLFTGEVAEFEFSKDGLSDLENNYFELLNTNSEIIFIGTHAVNDMDQLYESLWMWDHGPKLPDPDSDDPTDNEKYPISSHVWHQRIVLCLEVDPSLYKQIPIELIYWGLSKNILLVPKGTPSSLMVNAWRKIIHEDNGPLSRFRHDIKTTLRDVKYEKILASLLSEIQEAEDLFKSKAYDFSTLDRNLGGRRKSASVIEEYLIKQQAAVKQKSSLREPFQNITKTLSEVIGEDERFKQQLQDQKLMIYFLGELIGVN